MNPLRLCGSLLLILSISLPASARDYKIGLLLPYSGVYASLGQDIEAGFRLAQEHFGDQLGNDSITLLREDSEVKPPVGLVKARKLVLQDKVDVMVGIVSSGVLGAIRDFVHNSQVPLIVSNAGNNDMTGKRCSPYLIRVSFSNGQINRPLGTWMAQQGGRKKSYTLAPDYSAGHQMISAFTESFTAAGGEVVGGSFTPFRKTKDFASYLAQAAASGADSLYAFYSGSEAVAFVKQYHSFGIANKLPLYGPGWLNSPLYVRSQGEAANGLITALNYVPVIDNAENRRFQQDFQRQYKRPGSEFAVQGYDSGHLLIAAIKAASGDAGKLATTIKQAQFSGPRGPLQIDAATNNVVQNIYIYRTEVQSDRILHHILNVVPSVRDSRNGCQL